MITSFKHSKKVVLICGLSFLVSGCGISSDKEIEKNVTNDSKPIIVISATPTLVPKEQESKSNNSTAEDLKIDGTMPNDYTFKINGDKVEFTREDMTFEYTKQWVASREPDFWEADSEREASPEQGVILYIDKNNNEKVSVYSADSTWDEEFEKSKIDEGFEKSKYQTQSGAEWSVLTGKQNDKKSIIYGFNDERRSCVYFVEVLISDENFSEYEKDILNVLDSIRFK